MPEINNAPSTDSQSPSAGLPKPNEQVLRVKPTPSIWRRAFRMVMGIMITFGLGILLVILMLYIPIRQQLYDSSERIRELTNRTNTELEGANQEIVRLSAIEDRYKVLQAEFDRIMSQNAVVKIQLDVTNAQLALVREIPSQASQALSGTSERIAVLKKLLSDEQLKDIDNLEKRLELVLEEIEEDEFAAISDLEVMMAILLELENQLTH